MTPRQARTCAAPLALALALLPGACSRFAGGGDPCASFLAGPQQASKLKPVPRDGVLRLRVLYLEDPRVPLITASQRQELYRRVEALAGRWYGYRLELLEVGSRDLAQEFARRGPFDDADQEACFEQERIEPDTLAGRWALRSVAERVYAERGPEVFDQAFPGTRGVPASQAREAALSHFTRLYGAVSGMRNGSGALLGTPQQKRMYSFLHWVAYTRWTREADFLLTNATMVEAEGSMPLYVLARGGVTTGLTDNNAAAPYGAAGVVTLLPFLSGERFAQPAAPETPLPERLDAAATMWMHELGHFLLRYGEIYGEPGCVHSASTSLNYFQWHRAIRKADNACPRTPEVVERF